MPELPNSSTDDRSRAERRRAATRARLLAAARDVFAQHGLADATIAQITEAADLGFGTFYLHFPSKEAAFQAVILEGFAELRSRMEAVLEEGTPRPWWSLVEAGVQVFFAFAGENQELFPIMFAGGGLGIGLGLELQQRFAAQLTLFLLLGQTAPSAGPRMFPYPPEPIAFVLIAALSRSALWWLQQEPPERPTADVMSATLSRFIVSGLCGKTPGEETSLRGRQAMQSKGATL